MQMSDAREKIQTELEKATKQKQIWENRERRLANREKYLRSAKDRKRTHRLIQYGAAFECNHKELAVLTDVEVFTLVENILDIPGVSEAIAKSVSRHGKTIQEGGE